MLLFCLVTLIHLVGLPVLPKQTGHQTKGGTGDGPDVADAENEIPMALFLQSANSQSELK